MKVTRKFLGTVKTRHLLEELSPKDPKNPKLGNISIDRIESVNNAISALIANKSVQNGDRIQITFEVANGDVDNDYFAEVDWKLITILSWFVFGAYALIDYFYL